MYHYRVNGKNNIRFHSIDISIRAIDIRCRTLKMMNIRTTDFASLLWTTGSRIAYKDKKLSYRLETGHQQCIYL